MKIITMCGSLRFIDDINYHHRRLALAGNCVIGLVPASSDSDVPTPEQRELLSQEHFKKIDISDAIFVVNVDDYIGDATKREIEYARANGKEIMFLQEPDK